MTDNKVKEMFEKKVVMVNKKIRCPRCKGSGKFVSSKTGVRAMTAGEPLTDDKRACPKCRGKKTVVIRITEDQANREKAELDRRIRAKKAEIKRQADAEVKKIVEESE